LRLFGMRDAEQSARRKKKPFFTVACHAPMRSIINASQHQRPDDKIYNFILLNA
jgi:hypothetical protein